MRICFIYTYTWISVTETANGILEEMADPDLTITRDVPMVNISLGSGFYFACASLILHWFAAGYAFFYVWMFYYKS